MFNLDRRSAVTRLIVEHYHACKQLEAKAHHLHFECVLFNTLDRAHMGAAQYVPAAKARVVCEDATGNIIVDAVPIDFHSQDLQDFYDEIEDILTNPKCIFHIQFTPRLVMILEPFDELPFKIELIPISMSINDAINVVSSRKSLIDFFHFKNSAFGSRVHLFVTPTDALSMDSVAEQIISRQQKPAQETEKTEPQVTSEPVKAAPSPTLQPQSGQEVFKYTPPPRSSRPSLEELAKQTEAYVNSVRNDTPPPMPSEQRDNFSLNTNLKEKIDEETNREMDAVRAFMQQELDKIDLLTSRDSRPQNTPILSEGNPLDSDTALNPREIRGKTPDDQSILSPIIFTESENVDPEMEKLIGSSPDDTGPIPDPTTGPKNAE